MKETIYGIDGNQCFAHRPDFDCLQTSLCGFGDTNELALADLLRQEQEVCEHLEGLRLGRCPECGKQVINPEKDD